MSQSLFKIITKRFDKLFVHIIVFDIYREFCPYITERTMVTVKYTSQGRGKALAPPSCS